MGNLGIAQINSAEVQQQKKQSNAQAKSKQESVSFFDEKWSGYQIAKLTGDNFFTDWLQDKDKVCTDGKDDGKLSFWEGTKSFAKGLIGGIPKMIINHPVMTAATIGLGAAATVLTSGAILPALGALGVVAGVGMTGYGIYGAATAKTDGEAKLALETMGVGVTTAAVSVATADKALEKAAEAGVKSAQVAEDANIFQKTVQMFKSIPEALTKSKELSFSYLKGTPVNIEIADGAKQNAEGAFAENQVIDANKTNTYQNGELVQETIVEGNKTSYSEGEKLVTAREVPHPEEHIATNKEYLADGTNQNSTKSQVIKGKSPNGEKLVTAREVSHPEEHITITKEYFADGTMRETFKNRYISYGKVKEYYPNGKLKMTDNGIGLKEYFTPEGKQIASYYACDNGAPSITKIYDAHADLSGVPKGDIVANRAGVELVGYKLGDPLPEGVPGHADRVEILGGGKWKAYDTNGNNIASYGGSMELDPNSIEAIIGREEPNFHLNNVGYRKSDFTASELEKLRMHGYKIDGPYVHK